jgi:uncharacterized circularly permuted ATP-grasp superfamily protein
MAEELDTGTLTRQFQAQTVNSGMTNVINPSRHGQQSAGLFKDYPELPAWDEMMAAHGGPRLQAQSLYEKMEAVPREVWTARQEEADLLFLNQGITFNVYGAAEGTEKVFPYDLIPRILTSKEWTRIEAGLDQRLRALNLFLWDLYHEQDILKAGVVPRDLVESCKHFRKEMIGVDVPQKSYVQICGTDLVRIPDGSFAVLEDNLRVPSGVSYMLANRQVMKHVLPQLFGSYDVRPNDHYPMELLAALKYLAPKAVNEPVIVLLTPGVFNSAYYEHAFLARQMGIPLVEGRDLVVVNEKVWLKTTRGLRRVDVIYRRVDDDFIDPEVFRKDSVLGVPGLFSAYKAGNVAMSNAVGTGVADDKAIYAYVPRIIKHYLGEEAILPNVETYILDEPEALKYTLENMEKLVVKAVGEAGGYGMIIGPHATKEEIATFREIVKKNPRNYISQPTLQISTAPCLVDSMARPRHVDLRPYTVCGAKPVTVPGGLTRVALKEGSLVVNSSQGGGSKDTWVLY